MLDFFTGAFSSPYYLGSMLNSATILMIGACGAIFALLAGKMNLGGEGQIYAGGFITALLLNILPHSSTLMAILSLLTAFLAAALTTAFLTLLSGFLYQKNKIPELLTTFLISAAIIPMIDAAITVYFKSDGNLIALP
ncbi:MAG: ABC transporter permease, partial [Treponema sp.]|nr:ABC transporter permease [Treponema sp.]